MTPEDLHGLPSSAELIEATQEWLTRELAPKLDGRDAFMVRVVNNVLGQVEREMATGAEQAAAVSHELETLGYADEAALASAIRGRSVRIDDPEVIAVVRAVVDARLAVANPRYVERR
ncbi:MAG: DUF6285 domain-containing protein [Acidimicrobiales bacterium]